MSIRHGCRDGVSKSEAAPTLGDTILTRLEGNGTSFSTSGGSQRVGVDIFFRRKQGARYKTQQ